MKKFLLTSILALPFLALANQDASAWHQFKFGAGINLEGSGGGNSAFWGVWKSQQPPAPGGFGAPGVGYPGATAGAGVGGYGVGYPGATAGAGVGGYGMGSPVNAFPGTGYDIGADAPLPTPATSEPPAPLPQGVKKAGYWYGYEPATYYYGR
jgi:hypothetical protein